MQQKPKERKIKKGDLAKVIYELIDEFKLVRGNPRTGVAHKVLNAILASITGALQRGESVKIDGLGTFSTYTRKATNRRVAYFDGTRRPNPDTYVTIIQLKPKVKVKFTPSKTIIRTLNHES